MGVSIKKVKITNWGPLVEFFYELKPFTLIYGKNERGKTTFIEAIVSALFRIRRDFFIRNDENFVGRSEVWVSGVQESEVVYKNTSKTKLDDFIPQGVDLLSILCVHASDLRFPVRFLDLFDRFLFPYQELGKLRKNISDYVKIKNYQLLFEKNMGIKKEIDDYDSKLEMMNAVLSQIKDIAFYELKEMKDKKVFLESELEKLMRSKAGYLYNLKREYENKKTKFKRIDSLLRELKGRFIELSNRKKNLEGEIEQLSKKTLDIEYLRSVYESLNLFAKTTKLKGPFFILLTALVLGLVLLFTRSLPLYIQLIIFLFGAFLLLKIYKRSLKESYIDQRIKILSEEYKERYGKSLPSIEEIISELREKETIKKIYESKKEELKNCELEINKIYSNILDESKLDSSLDIVSIFKKLEEERDSLQNEIESLQDTMMSLGDVKPEPLLEESILYDANREKTLIKELESLSRKINEVEKSLSSLKAKVIGMLNLKEDMDIIELARLLEERVKELSFILKDKYILALVYGVINNVIERIENKRSEIIKEELLSNRMTSFLKMFSNQKYHRVFIEKDFLFVEAEDKTKIPFDYLSSGAQEQVLLAIRASLSLRVCGKEMFFLLDDPLLHTDWERRPKAVDAFLELVKNNWQVIYLTLDDYTKDIICSKAKVLKDNFKFIEL